jgi:hypothetical protein
MSETDILDALEKEADGQDRILAGIKKVSSDADRILEQIGNLFTAPTQSPTPMQPQSNETDPNAIAPQTGAGATAS